MKILPDELSKTYKYIQVIYKLYISINNTMLCTRNTNMDIQLEI